MSRANCLSILERINSALGYDPKRAGMYNAAIGACSAGYAVYSQSPGDGKTRHQLHLYDGKGSYVIDDCSWSWSVGIGEFYGKLVAFLRGIEARGAIAEGSDE